MSILHREANRDLGSVLNVSISSALDTASEGWFDPIGVLPNNYVPRDVDTEGEDGDMYFLRGIAEAYRLGPEILPSNLRDSMKVVLGVHYNIIRDHATLSSNTYSRSWTGPRSSSESFNLYNQAAAAQVLVDGISIFSSNADNSTSSSGVAPGPSATGSSPAAQSQSKPSPGTIAGATVGTLSFLMLLAIAIVLVTRRRRRRRQQLPSTGIITPFLGSLYEKRATPRRKDEPEPTTPNPMNESGGQTNNRPQSEPYAPTAHDTTPGPQEHTGEAEPVEMSPTFPDMVRAVYQRLWQPEGSERPPDYRSTAGEPAGR
ncbi:hypothetical protein PQX77_012933 [Marasmius sp. AFHP31]|nr:hypothetical protein PQX77_012933 [Marasmius sp. AFHP31]